MRVYDLALTIDRPIALALDGANATLSVSPNIMIFRHFISFRFIHFHSSHFGFLSLTRVSRGCLTLLLTKAGKQTQLLGTEIDSDNKRHAQAQTKGRIDCRLWRSLLVREKVGG